MHRILVIANRTCECPAVVDEVHRRATEADADVLLVAPAVNSRLAHYVSDTDGAVADAQQRVHGVAGQLAERGISIRGEVGDADPLQAIDDALAGGFAAHELVIATHPPERSHWLEKRLLERAQERFDLPITHLVSRYALDA